MTNYLAIFCIGGALFMGSVSIFLGLYNIALICLLGSLSYLLVYYLNHRRFYRAGGLLFIALSNLIILSLSIASIRTNLYSGVEYIFLSVMAVPLLLLEGKAKVFSYWMTFLMLIGVKVMRNEYWNLEYDKQFLIVSLNLLFAAWFLFLFLNFFKKVLLRAVAKTNEHEKTLYSLLDNVPVFMALVDRSGNYKIANDHYSNMFGFEKGEIIGKRRSKILPENILKTHQPYFEKALRGDSVSFLERDVLPSGKGIYSKGTYVPVRNDNDQIEAISIYVDDVSELVEAEESLRRASETKDKLFSIIAHDIRSPLNLFQSLLNISDEETISKEEFIRYQKEIKERLTTLRERLDELLDWARIQMGGINAYPSEVDANEVVKENADLFKTLIERKEILFKMKLHCEVDGWMDENHLQVAIRNLLHNALKYTEAGGEVVVETSTDDDSVLIEIMDSGAGMSPEVQDLILKKEIQKSSIGTSGEVGTGLGLSLSLGLLEKNGCIVSLDSEIGKGSTFRIWIPKSDINDPVNTD
ncbi:MAG: PAS domain-containing sensor histidine kinase [Cyclobacteriaceae bacterium]